MDVPAGHELSRRQLLLSAQEPFPLLATDAACACLADLDGIEMDAATYETIGPGHVCQWQSSRSLNRLRGWIVLGSSPPTSVGFANYLGRINRDVRYVRVGQTQGRVAVQAIVPAHDTGWRAVATKALQTVVEILLPQAAWWSKNGRLVEDLLREVGD
jgi:hypothetical protein